MEKKKNEKQQKSMFKNYLIAKLNKLLIDPFFTDIYSLYYGGLYISFFKEKNSEQLDFKKIGILYEACNIFVIKTRKNAYYCVVSEKKNFGNLTFLSFFNILFFCSIQIKNDKNVNIELHCFSKNLFINTNNILYGIWKVIDYNSILNGEFLDINNVLLEEQKINFTYTQIISFISSINLYYVNFVKNDNEYCVYCTNKKEIHINYEIMYELINQKVVIVNYKVDLFNSRNESWVFETFEKFELFLYKKNKNIWEKDLLLNLNYLKFYVE